MVAVLLSTLIGGVFAAQNVPGTTSPCEELPKQGWRVRDKEERSGGKRLVVEST